MNYLRTASMMIACVALAACGGNVMPGNDGSVTGDSATGDSAVANDGSMMMMGGDAAVDPFSVPPQCSSGRMWTSGNRGSDNMNPGQPCIACHNISRGAPRFSIAGTVYRTGFEPNNCNGGAAAGTEPVTVEITDAMGMVFTLPVFAASGNFFREGAITPPYRARVLQGGRARVMNTPQTDGDCNTCHGATGTMGAPGRIALP